MVTLDAVPLPEARRDAAGRPFARAALDAIVRELAAFDPDRFAHLVSDRILFVAGQARRASRASVRPLTFGGSPPRRAHRGFEKPIITVHGVHMLYEICLRPRFFLKSDPVQRARTFVHELWHISPELDGTLAAPRRHTRVNEAQIDPEPSRIADAWLDARRGVPDLFTFEGELRIPAWMSRPPSRFPVGSAYRRHYDERDLYDAIVEQRAMMNPRGS